MPRKLRTFLCHVSQDKSTVRELYRQLLSEDWIDPWLDEEKILPGQDWDMEIEKAVETADAVIMCLSKYFANKEGYIQKEVKRVLEISELKPEGTIYMIPLRLEKCDPPRRLAKWQYIDYFPRERQKEAYNRLLSSLNLRAERLFEDEKSNNADDYQLSDGLEDDLHFLINWFRFGVLTNIEIIGEYSRLNETEKIEKLIPDLEKNARGVVNQLKSLHTLLLNKSPEDDDLINGVEKLIETWRIRTYVAYNDDHRIQIGLDAPKSIIVPKIIQAVTLRIVSEAISNAITHSGITTDPSVSVKIVVRKTTEGVLCEISDNGMGVAEIKPGMGIERMKDLVRQLNTNKKCDADLKINSEVNKGTIVQFKVDNFY